MRAGMITAILVALFVLAYLTFASGGGENITYVTAPVTQGRLHESVTSSGTVNAVTTVEVGSQLSGQIDTLRADFNDAVRKGQPLAILDQQSYQARLAQARAALEMARADIRTQEAEVQRAKEGVRKTQAMRAVLEARRDSAKAKFTAADNDLERKQRLGSGGTVSASTIDEVLAVHLAAAAELREAEANLSAHEIDLAVARAELSREKAELQNSLADIPEKEATLKLAEVELERTTIRSPIDGIVINRNIDAGQTVAASLEAPTLFTIAQDLSEMEVHARIDETDIGKIKLGQKAGFRVDAFPKRRFAGEVVQIRKAPEVVQNVVTYTVVIRTRNEALLLLPGMTALVEILVMESEPANLIPTDALRYSPADGARTGEGGGRNIVWKVVDGDPEPVEIETGASDARSTAVLSGALEPGDEVIVNEIAQQPTRRDIFGVRLGF